MEALIAAFDDGLLHHGDLAEPLQAFYCSRAELRSEDRDEYIEHLKRIGKYMYEPGFWQIEPGEFLEVGCQILIRDDAAGGVGERRCRRILRILGEILHG